MKMGCIQMNVDYRGGNIDIRATTEQHCVGSIYPVNMNGTYAFTIYNDDNEDWGILREDNGVTPEIDPDLYKTILKQLKWELQYDA